MCLSPPLGAASTTRNVSSNRGYFAPRPEVCRARLISLHNKAAGSQIKTGGFRQVNS
jgi:hypothetical protein